MIGVGDDVAILAEHVEYGKRVRREAADAAGFLVAVKARFALEALVAEGERRGPHVDEIAGGHEFRALRPVRVDGDVVDRLLDLVGHGAALDAIEMEIGLVVDAPEFVGHERAGAVRIERCIRVDMDRPAAWHRRWS